MKVVYYADDGTEFETEDECREYEKKMANILIEFTNSIHAYDDNGKVINLNDYDTEEWEEAFEKITHIQFDTQKAIDCYLKHAISEYGMLYIASDINREVKVGERYFYDWDADKWACLDDKQKALDKIASVFKNKGE